MGRSLDDVRLYGRAPTSSPHELCPLLGLDAVSFPPSSPQPPSTLNRPGRPARVAWAFESKNAWQSIGCPTSCRAWAPGERRRAPRQFSGDSNGQITQLLSDPYIIMCGSCIHFLTLSVIDMKQKVAYMLTLSAPFADVSRARPCSTPVCKPPCFHRTRSSPMPEPAMLWLDSLLSSGRMILPQCLSKPSLPGAVSSSGFKALLVFHGTEAGARTPLTHSFSSAL
ncbi:hypothetical protein VTK26DRAFT_2257 [Humicola hyalothermophila]